MSEEQENKNNNPLSLIFKTNIKGEIIEELNSIKSIPLFFEYLSNEKISQKMKIEVIDKFIEIINENRYICEFFSLYNNKSIYIYFFELYLSKTSSEELKSMILKLLKELIINIETTKTVYEFIFQKFSNLYRSIDEPTSKALFDILTLLNTILGETDIQKPRNYFSCSGNGRFEIDLSNKKIELGTYLTFIMNFKICSSGMSMESPDSIGTTKIIKVDFSNDQSFTIELENQMNLKIKGVDTNIKVCSKNEWINLVLCIHNTNKELQFYFVVNGENILKSYKIDTLKLKSDDNIDSVIFFDNFYGEVTSMSMAITNEANNWCLSNDFLKWFINYKQGFWKKKYLDNFLKMLKELEPTNSNIHKKSKTVYFKPQDLKRSLDIEGSFKKNYSDYLIFVFTPFNSYKGNIGEVENISGKLKLNYSGNIRNHQYQCYQKKLSLVEGITNLIPLAELFLIWPKTLNEENLELFLKIIINILNYRKFNIKSVKEFNLFRILSLFFEKYPNYLFTEKVLENFINIGKTIFSNSDEALCSCYFEHIFLNEKILSKYSENLQIKFWQQVLLFCQSDKDQIETFMNMNRICLILRFYDKNKYIQMCCEKHLSQLKEEYIGNKTVMNPTMESKLSNLQKLLNLVIESQDPANVISLFKLLTLDLSPCLTKFILNILIKALQNPSKEDIWKNKLIEEFISNKYEIIVINTFIHSLPDVRFDLLMLMFQIHSMLIKTGKISNFKNFEKMIKTSLLPKKMFYASYKESKTYHDKIKKKKMEEKIKKLEGTKQKKNSLRTSSIVSENYKKELNSFKIDLTVTDKINEENENNENEGKKNIEKEKSDKNDNNNKQSKINENTEENNKNEEKKKLIENKEGDNIKNIEENIKINEEQKDSKEKKDNDSFDFEDNLNLNFENKINSSNDIRTNDEDFIRKTSTTANFDLRGSNFGRFNTAADIELVTNDEDPEIKSNKKEDEKKERNSKDEEENTKEEEEKDTQKEIVIKDELSEKYKNDLFNKFLIWSFGEAIEEDLSSVDLFKIDIQYINILEILFSLEKEAKDNNLTQKIFKSFEKLTKSNNKNCYLLLTNNKIYSLLLETTFKFYKNEDENQKGLYQIGKTVLINAFINSFIYDEKNKLEKYPCYEIESIISWGKTILKTIQYNNSVYDFLNELLVDFVNLFRLKYIKNVDLTTENEIKSSFYIKNYLIMITLLFRFSFHFENTSVDDDKINLKNQLMEKYTSSMHIDFSKDCIKEMWVNFPLFEGVYKILNFLWSKENTYKRYKLSKTKGNKVIKYEKTILEKIILDKNNKNVHQNELKLLTYEELNQDSSLEQIIPLIRTIPITLMSIISVLSKKGNNEEEMLYWLKEYKKFMMFVIISSSNLTRVNQLDFYNYVQSKCIGTLISSICFLKDILTNTSFSSKNVKEKIRKTFHSILLFYFIITKYQYKYIIKHKSGIKFFNISTKPARNDLKLSAIFLIFTEVIKDKTGNSILPLSKLDNLSISQFIGIIDLLDKPEWNEALFNNQNIKNKIMKEFFTFNCFKNEKDVSKEISDEMIEEKYTEEILNLLPLYEKELSKYSNSSLENSIQKKNKYKAIKKKSFSWKGYWSDRKLFFDNVEELKLKLINHYTKTFMRPILVPILDVEYYLPEFSGFKIENLFLEKEKNGNNKNGFKFTLDIDKILKLSEQNQISMNNIKESFGEKKSKIRENYLKKIYLKSNPKLAESLKKITNSLDFGKEEEFTKLEHTNDDSSSDDNNNNLKNKYFLSCLVKTSHHIKGVCFIDENKLNFKVFLNQRTGNSMSGVELAFTNKDDDYDQERQTCFGSYFVCHPKDKDLYQITINYKDIKWIFRRRYYYKDSALEIFTTTNKSFYLNFKYENDREFVIKELEKNIKDLSRIYDDLKDPKDNFDNIIGYENASVIHNSKKSKKIKLSKKIEMWKNWEINNFELLMWLNIFGNRSYHDISQYPVFPWILSNYEDPLKKEKKVEPKKEKSKKLNNSVNSEIIDDDDEEEDDNNILEYSYRDMNLPMGMMELNEEGERRKELFMETYETLKNESEGEIKPYIYGTNYSNPMYVCHFLTRLFPFTHISIELQGSKFDNADRLFLSVKDSFFNSLTHKTDVKELIPEFFYLPEMFININELNFGKKEDGEVVNDVLTPCENNPFDFIITMKTVLEGEKLSKTIQNWIDLIFGYKARGKEAENSHNLFTQQSYQESVNIKTVENKESMLRQVEFGLIPTQILNKECGKKLKKEDILKGKEILDSTFEKCYNKCKKNEENLNRKRSKEKKDKDKDVIKDKEKSDEGAILCVGVFNPEKISILLNNDIYIEKKISCPVFDKVFTDELVNKKYLEKSYNKMSEFYSNDSSNNKAMTFFKHGKMLIMGGFFDGKVIFTHLDDKLPPTIITPFKDESPILAITSDKEDELFFMGNWIGNVGVYKYSEDGLKMVKLLTDQSSPISHIFCNDELNLLATASIDGCICLYTLPLCKLVRCIKVPTDNCTYVFLSESPLPSILAISDEDNISQIFVYSINGKFYQKKEEYFKISKPILIKDINSKDYLSCIGNENIYIISIPDLSVQATFDKLFGVHSFCFSEDKKILYALNKKGTEVTVIKEEKQKFYRSSSFMKK